MLTVEQVKKHSDLSIQKSSIEADFTRCKARLLYRHNGRLSKLAIVCALPNFLIATDLEHVTEEGISLFIEWGKFTEWINKHDDLEEGNLLTAKQYFYYFFLQRHKQKGRNGTLDLTRNVVIDYNKEVLV